MQKTTPVRISLTVLKKGDKNMEKVLDNEFATLYAYPEKKIVHHVIKKFIFGEAFQKLMTTGADIFIKYRCTKWLSDDRKKLRTPPTRCRMGTT